MTTTEFKLVYLRDAPNGPAELVIGNGDADCMIVVLRPTQLKRLAIDATNKAISGSITS
ncbi:MAG TPA: hypothetical protein VFA65_24405 [Bryobacteraceae bacterium]|nr:hypothetical protein [Bryobacteraceae bacterium]